jgi:hypothetical protein
VLKVLARKCRANFAQLKSSRYFDTGKSFVDELQHHITLKTTDGWK